MAFCFRSVSTRLFLLLCLLPTGVVADEISLHFADGLQGLADYQPGDTDRPAVLVLHGFLQTHDFSTVKLVRSELAAAGYAVLSPTLTLNIDQRKQSLTCDAIQNHNVEQSTGELAAWIAWLKKEGYEKIILIGHSTGSNNLLSYLSEKPDPVVTAFIATSLGPIGKGAATPAEEAPEPAPAKTDGDHTALKKYSLGFCRKNYTTTPEHFSSYLQWNRAQMLEDLEAVPVPTTVVLGGADKWLPAGWRKTLQERNVNIQVIDDANHYFSGLSEFDFQETILQLVEDAATKSGIR